VEAKAENTSRMRFISWREMLLWLALACVLAGAYAVYYVKVHSVHAAKISEIEKVLYNKEERWQELQEISGNLRLFEKKVEFLKEKLAEKRLALPQEPEIPDLLSKLRTIGEKSGVSSLALMLDKAGSYKCYTLINVNFKVEGTSEQLIAFFNGVLHSERLINVQELTLFRSGPEPHNGVVSAFGTFEAFSFKGPRCVWSDSYKWYLLKAIYEE